MDTNEDAIWGVSRRAFGSDGSRAHGKTHTPLSTTLEKLKVTRKRCKDSLGEGSSRRLYLPLLAGHGRMRKRNEGTEEPSVGPFKM